MEEEKERKTNGQFEWREAGWPQRAQRGLLGSGWLMGMEWDS